MLDVISLVSVVFTIEEVGVSEVTVSLGVVVVVSAVLDRVV